MQEYERAVIFRLGRLLHGGSRGPGKFLENTLGCLDFHRFGKIEAPYNVTDSTLKRHFLLFQEFFLCCPALNHIKRWIYVLLH